MAMHLMYCLRSAAEAGVTVHPQEHMRSLGIKYQHATPQSMGDQWWFWNCENIPLPIPFGLGVLDIVDPGKYVGFGLTQGEADKIKSYKSATKGQQYQRKGIKCQNKNA
jgi:hypothetical protein